MQYEISKYKEKNVAEFSKTFIDSFSKIMIEEK